MADYTTRKVRTNTYEWVLRSPTNVVEIEKSYSAAEHTAETYGINTDCDDWISVSSRDDEIVLSFTIEEPI